MKLSGNAWCRQRALMTQELARVFEAAIARHPEDWHMLQKVFVADLDPDRLAQLRGQS